MTSRKGFRVCTRKKKKVVQILPPRRFFTLTNKETNLLESLYSYEMTFPKPDRAAQRPGYGTLGHNCVVYSNHFPVQLNPSDDYYHYKVTFTPEIAPKKVSEILELFRGHSELGGKILIYDGKENVYSVGPLPFTSNNFVVHLFGRSRVEVSIKLDARLDLCRVDGDIPRQIVEALDADLQWDESEIISRNFQLTQTGLTLCIEMSRPLSSQALALAQILHRSISLNCSILRHFGCNIDGRCITISSRVLPPPTLQYLGEQVVPQAGAWNIGGKKMVNGAKVEFWTCLSFSESLSQQDVTRFCNSLATMCNDKGMDFNPEPCYRIQCRDVTANIYREILDIHYFSSKMLREGGRGSDELQILLIIMPESDVFYGTINYLCDTGYDIISQCCTVENAMNCKDEFLERMAMKINAKVGGRTHVLCCSIQNKYPFVTDEYTIIFGGAVNQFGSSDIWKPITSVVATMDWPEIMKYKALVSQQDQEDGIIHNLYKIRNDPYDGKIESGMVRELLLKFSESNNGNKPARIIFYRDGGSNGRFSPVFLKEIEAIRKACQSLQENYLPRITYVVVQRSHHTRFFATKHDDEKWSENISPGTIVETRVCHPSAFDFYLYSHSGFDEARKSAHYHVLHDENSFTADAIQTLSYNLCYTHATHTNSVSIVTPIYYAHKAASHANVYRGGFSTKGGDINAGAVRKMSNTMPLPLILRNVKDSMFFC